MDTTYFGRKFGVKVFKDSLTGDILFKQYVQQETNKLYSLGIEEITKRGIKVQSIICDGRKGLLQLFENISVQMCNFIPLLELFPTKNWNKYLMIVSYSKMLEINQHWRASWDYWLILGKTD